MGALVQISDLYPLMMGHLPGIDAYTLDQHLQQASREFCDRSEAFRETLTRNLVADQAAYVLTPSYDCRIKRILEVWLKTDNDITAGADGTLVDSRYYTFRTATGTLTLDNAYKPSVAVTGGLVVKVVLVPEITQTGTNVLSEDFLNVWADGLMFRAFFTLMSMPRQRWTNLDRLAGAPFYYGEYLRKLSDALTESAMNNTTEPDGWSA
jgi:hypothetical protein